MCIVQTKTKHCANMVFSFAKPYHCQQLYVGLHKYIFTTGSQLA